MGWKRIQARHGLEAEQSRAGLAWSVVTGLTGLDPRLYAATKCGQTCQGGNHRDKPVLPEQVCCGQREDLPLVFLPPWQGHLSGAPDGETWFVFFGLTVPWV